MIHEHEATELASAAIDFGLTPELDAELAVNLRDCPVCAERAASYREQIRLMQRLPVIDASDATRRRVAAAAMGGAGRSDRSPLMLLLAAALLVALLLALTAAAGAMLQNRKPQDLLADAPSASPAQTARLESSGPSAAPVDAAGAVFPDQLAPDSLAEVVEANIRVRSKPGVSADSKRLSPFLQPGDRLFVVDGPVIADNYDWYQVVPIGTDPARPGSKLPSGWVSRGDHDATPWIKPVEPDCPAVPVDVGQLTSIHPLERVACFHDTKLSFWAVVDSGTETGWIAESYAGASADAQVAGLDLALRPLFTGSTSLPQGRPMLLDGNFDDNECRKAGSDALKTLQCRAQFATSRATDDDLALDADIPAITVTDDLRVRSQPIVDDASAKFELLPRGTRLGLIGGPAVGSGYVWYHVAVPSIRTPTGGLRTGWVAAHAPSGELWVGADELACPPPTGVTVPDLAQLTSAPVYHGGVVCYGRHAADLNAEITLRSYIRRDCTGTAGSSTPWLRDPRRGVVLVDGSAEVTAVLTDEAAGSAGCDGSVRRKLFDVTGHFDDAAAEECRSAPDGAAAVYECRNRFVITRLSAAAPDGALPSP
jgi:anti-sigma factor RsiW